MLAVALQIADDYSTMFKPHLVVSISPKMKRDPPIRLVESRLPGLPKYQRVIITRRAL